MPASDLFQAIGGTAGCRMLAERFYARVKLDPVLRPFFPGKSMRCAIEAFSAFLVQFLGGPPDDAGRRYWVSLRESHQRFRIGSKERDAWMKLMTEALAESGMEKPAREAFLRFFEQSSAYVVNEGTAPVTDGGTMHAELAQRWDRQRTMDDAVAAIRRSDADAAITLADGVARHASIYVGLLSLMIESGDTAMIARVEEKLRARPELAAVRYYGRTLLHTAAAAGCPRIVETMLQLGADPNAADGGGHPPLYSLGNGCTQGGADVVRALLGAGADVNAQSGVKRCSALHMAARRGNVELAAALLDCGVQIDARDSQGVTPLGRAINCRKPGVAALLRARGAVD